jgi:hypothetical protein
MISEAPPGPLRGNNVIDDLLGRVEAVLAGVRRCRSTATEAGAEGVRRKRKRNAAKADSRASTSDRVGNITVLTTKAAIEVGVKRILLDDETRELRRRLWSAESMLTRMSGLILEVSASS